MEIMLNTNKKNSMDSVDSLVEIQVKQEFLPSLVVTAQSSTVYRPITILGKL